MVLHNPVTSRHKTPCVAKRQISPHYQHHRSQHKTLYRQTLSYLSLRGGRLKRPGVFIAPRGHFVILSIQVNLIPGTIESHVVRPPHKNKSSQHVRRFVSACNDAGGSLTTCHNFDRRLRPFPRNHENHQHPRRCRRRCPFRGRRPVGECPQSQSSF
jgi:hypothetical protein